MAIRAAIASGDWLTAGTWGLVDATSYLNAETGTETVTTAYAGTRSAAFTPGAITIDGIGIRFSNRTGVTGTVSVHLEAATVEVAGTLVTIDVADLPEIVTADVNGGWAFFKFAAPVLLVAATAYTVAIQTSSASQLNVYRDGTDDNLCRYLRTTTTGARAAGDDGIITGDYTAAGVSAAVVVTMNALAGAITDYGAGSTSLVLPSLSISQGGSLVYGTAAATAYYLRESGNVVVYIGGTLSMGTTGTPIPRDSTAVLNFDCGANVDFGLTIRNGGTFHAQGLSRTAGKDIYTCKLNTDEAIASTSLGVDADTGWLDNDVIAVASTTRTATQCEQGTLNGAAGAADLPVDGFAGAGGGLAFAHLGTSPTQAEVILLTRNVQIFGASATLQSYIDIKATATVDVDWTEFFWLGSGTALKLGINCATTTGSVSIRFSSLHDFAVTSSVGFNVTGTTSDLWEFSDNVTWLVRRDNIAVTLTTGTGWTINNCVFMRNVTGVAMVALSSMSGTLTNCTVAGSIGSGFSFQENGVMRVGTISGLVAHSCALNGFDLGGSTGLVSGERSTIGALTAWRNNSQGFVVGGGGVVNVVNVTFTSITGFGQARNLVLNALMVNVIVNAMTFSGDTSFSSQSGIQVNFGGGLVDCVFNNVSMGVVSGIFTAHTIGDLHLSSDRPLQIRCAFRNAIFASATEFSGQTSLPTGMWIGSERHDGVAGAHKMWKREGTIAIETGTVHTGSQALSMTPNANATAADRFETQAFACAVANGATITPSVFVNKSAAYDGAQPRLVLRANPAIGIAADVVLATYAAGTGSWNALSGTSAAVTDDGVLEFYVDCTFGTGGVVFVDTVTVT